MRPRFRQLELRVPEPMKFHVRPTYLVLRSEDGFTRIYGTRRSPEGIDWRREFVVIVERGECPTGGYSVSITGITRESPERLVVTVATRDPAPDDFVTMMVTYPRAAVVVERAGLEEVRTVTFVDPAGKTLATVEVEP